MLALDHSAELGGAEIGLIHMARTFGDDLSVLLLEDGPLVPRLHAVGCRPIIFPVNTMIGSGLAHGPRAAGRVPTLVRVGRLVRNQIVDAMDEHGCDALLLNSSRSILLAAAANLPRRIHCVAMIRDSVSPPYLSRLRSVLAHLSVRSAAATVVANSSWTLRQLKISMPGHVVPPFIDREMFERPVIPRPRAGRGRRILILGRLAPWKGQLLGLAAIGRVRPDLIDRVTVAGAAWFHEQEYGDSVELGASALRNRGVDVRVVGHVDDVIDVIDAHDVVVHTSILPEPFGQVVVQGMARGRVVIAARAGGPAETIEHEKTGYHYRMADERSLAEVVERTLCDDTGTQKIRVAARIAGRQYHPDRTADRLRSVLSDHGSPRMVLR